MNKQDWLDLLHKLGQDGEFIVQAVMQNLPAIEALIKEIIQIASEAKKGS